MTKILAKKIVSLYTILKIVYLYRFKRYIFEYRCPPLGTERKEEREVTERNGIERARKGTGLRGTERNGTEMAQKGTRLRGHGKGARLRGHGIERE